MDAQKFFESSSPESTSKTPRGNSDMHDSVKTLTPLGKIASAEVLHQPQSSLADIRLAKGLHQSLDACSVTKTSDIIENVKSDAIRCNYRTPPD